MDKFIENPIFGVLLTLVAGYIGVKVAGRLKSGFANPVLVAMAIIIPFLYFADIPYKTYMIGGSMIHAFLGPITVILAVPLYQNRLNLKKYYRSILAGVLVGSGVAVLSVLLLAYFMGLGDEITKSILGRSVTTPIGIAIAEMQGGSASLAILSVMITGMTSLAVAPFLFRILKIKHPVAIGVALGTASHAIGTTRAMEYGRVEGAMSALSIGLAGVTTVLWVVLLMVFGGV